MRLCEKVQGIPETGEISVYIDSVGEVTYSAFRCITERDCQRRAGRANDLMWVNASAIFGMAPRWLELKWIRRFFALTKEVSTTIKNRGKAKDDGIF